MKRLLIASAAAVLLVTPVRAAQAPQAIQGLWCPAQPKSNDTMMRGPNWRRYDRTGPGTGEAVQENCVTILSNGLVEKTGACLFTAVKQIHPGSYEMTLKCMGIDPKQASSVSSYVGKKTFDLINGELTITDETSEPRR
jgi:hypothetical protein